MQIHGHCWEAAFSPGRRQRRLRARHHIWKHPMSQCASTRLKKKPRHVSGASAEHPGLPSSACCRRTARCRPPRLQAATAAAILARARQVDLDLALADHAALNMLMAFSASTWLLISTKAKPFD